MTWTKPQARTFIIASSTAGWTDEQRYAVMLYAGCPKGENQRPSVKHPGNMGRHFCECMAIAEADCAAKGVRLFKPSKAPSWAAACEDTRTAEIAKARQIADEAMRRLPAIFSEGLLAYTVRHVADHTSNPMLPGIKPERLEQCDGPTVHRVVESLKSFVGRKFELAGIKPHSFEITGAVRRRADRERTRRSA